jgi:chemotaxis family two-component system response regulator Rcp1
MNTISVLLVEDNPADADLTREAFEANRLKVELSVVLDGVEAMDFLHKRAGFADVDEPDLVLLDLNLPRKDGRQVLAEIKATDRLRKIPVVVLSSSEDLGDILQTYDLGANCYVSKPVDFEGFQATMKSLKRFWFSTARLPSDRRHSGDLFDDD